MKMIELAVKFILLKLLDYYVAFEMNYIMSFVLQKLQFFPRLRQIREKSYI